MYGLQGRIIARPGMRDDLIAGMGESVELRPVGGQGLA
jgi:hypothetical protein